MKRRETRHENGTDKSGEVKSCGCLRRDVSTNRHLTHGLSHHPLFRVWWSMLERCYSESNKSFCDYGGRGIFVCDEWKDDFKTFYDWAIGNGYKDGLSIDRIDNDGNYEPSNCRWVEKITQNNNKRNNKFITYHGKTQSVAEWSRELNIPYRTLLSRINSYGWSIEKAFETK